MFTKFFGVTNRNKFLNELEKVLNTKFADKTIVDKVIESIGEANGIASLDASGKVPSEQLPSYVDDIVEVEDYAHLPEIGETGKIYVTLDTGTQYRWGGSEYVPLNENSVQGIGIKKIIELSKTEYDALATKDINTIYFVDCSSASFAGLEICPAPLYYGANGFEIKDNDWNHDSFNSVYGKNEGSYYFNYFELGSYFDSAGASFDANSGDIDNANTLDGWRLPTASELEYLVLLNNKTRPGSTVNGVANVHYACVKPTGDYNGILLFPDNFVITGAALTSTDTKDSYSTLSINQINDYVNQGCCYFGATGNYFNNNWYNKERAIYSCANEDTISNNNILSYRYWSSQYYLEIGTTSKDSNYAMVRLVRSAQKVQKLYIGSILIADSNLPNEIEQLLASI